MVPADSDRIPRVPPYSGYCYRLRNLPVQDFHLLWSTFPGNSRSFVLSLAVLQPLNCRNNSGLGYFHFARHYSENRCFFLFLRLLRCFSSAGLLTLQCDRPSACRVAPFGYLRIKSCLQIPGAFRSLPRPSSPPRAKASSVRPCLLSLTKSLP